MIQINSGLKQNGVEMSWNCFILLYVENREIFHNSFNLYNPIFSKVDYHSCAGILQTFVYKSSCNQNREKKKKYRSAEIS